MINVTNVSLMLTEKFQKIVFVKKDIMKFILLSVHNVIIIVLNVLVIQVVMVVLLTEIQFQTVHVSSIGMITPEFVNHVLINVTVVSIMMNVTDVQLMLTESMPQLVTVMLDFMKLVLNNVQNVLVLVTPVLTTV